MSILNSLLAIIQGFKLCFTRKEIRRLAFWPWLVGFVCYGSAVVGAFYTHGPILAWVVGTPEGFWMTIVYYLAWVLVAMLLLVASMLVTIVFVMIFTSVFQNAIATRVLRDAGIAVPEETTGVSGVAKETARTLVVESAKLLWLLPLGALVFLVGFIPILAPVALFAAAWLLAYQFVDVVLDVLKVGAWKRLLFAVRHGLTMVLFGLTLSLCWAVPFLGFLLPPIAVAGAAWLLEKNKLLVPYLENQTPQELPANL